MSKLTRTETIGSYVQQDEKGEVRALIGKDATLLMRSATVISGLRMHIQTGGRMRLTRSANPKNLLAIASEFTGKKYKTSMPNYVQALEDLQKWHETMKAALPYVGPNGEQV